LHVQLLLKIADVLYANPSAIHVQVHVHVVERLEDVGYPAALVVVIYAVEYHVLHLHGFWAGDQPDHAVSNGYAIVIIRIDISGRDGPLRMDGRTGANQ
jgi:hypothetical protein